MSIEFPAGPVSAVFSAARLAANHGQNFFISDRVFPVYYSDRQTEAILSVDATDASRKATDDERAPGAPANRVVFPHQFETPFRAKHHTHTEKLPFENIVTGNPTLDQINTIERRAVRIANVLKLNKEKSAIAALNAISGSRKEPMESKVNDDSAGSTPISEIVSKLDMGGIVANAVVMGPRTFRTLRRHPEVQAEILGGGGSTAENRTQDYVRQAMSEIIGANIITPQWTLVENTASFGANPSYSRLWDDFIALLYIDDPSLQTASATSAVVWAPTMPDEAQPQVGVRDSDGWQVLLMPMVEDDFSSRLNVGQYYEMKVLKPNHILLLEDPFLPPNGD